MNPHRSGITLGVGDLNRAKQFYSEGLGWPIQQEQGEWVGFSLGNGSSVLGLLPWDALADDAGVAAGGSGFWRVAATDPNEPFRNQRKPALRHRLERLNCRPRGPRTVGASAGGGLRFDPGAG